jgi:C4-dicarboxylate-binding protein DctP
LIASLAAAAMLAAGTAGAEAKTTLRLTIQLPLKSVLGQNVLMFKEEVEKATKGEIEIQIYDSGSL